MILRCISRVQFEEPTKYNGLKVVAYNKYMWKIVLVLLLSCSMAQIRGEQQVIQAIRNDNTYADDGYQTIPVDDLNDLHTFLKTIIETSYPLLKDWLLADIKEKYDNNTDQTLYLYTYLKIVIGANNLREVEDFKSVPVISHQTNSLFTIFEGSTALQTYAPPKQPRPQSPIVGGFSSINNISNLTKIQQNAQIFVLSSVPQLANWTLVAVRTQVVAGQNICFTYQAPDSNNTQEYCVFSQVWNNNYMKLTLPSGEIIQVEGKGTAPPAQGSTPPPPPPPPPPKESTPPSNGSAPLPAVGSGSPLVGIIPPENRLLQSQN